MQKAGIGSVRCTMEHKWNVSEGSQYLHKGSEECSELHAEKHFHHFLCFPTWTMFRFLYMHHVGGTEKVEHEKYGATNSYDSGREE